MTDSYEDFIYEQMSLFADQGLRVLALAQKTWVGELNEKSNIPQSDIEKSLTFLGLVGLWSAENGDRRCYERHVHNI